MHLASACTTFQPQTVDISNIIAGVPPSQQQAQQVQQECLETGFLAVTGHGITDVQLQQLFSAAQRFFDLPLTEKMQYAVGDMQRGRGYEISPEHKQYMLNQAQTQQKQQTGHHEPSAVAGILSERFCCGPPLSTAQLQDPYYSSELGQVFFAPNSWPEAVVPELQPAMQQCYSHCEVISAAVLRLFAASLGVDQNIFAEKIDRHHSNMQVANYPSQLCDPGPHHLRKKAHVDSGTLTLLASQDWSPSSQWQAGDGGLQLISRKGEWLEVELPPGALLLNLGSLMTRWTNGLWKSTLHRVTNPPASKAHSSRRLSMAFFHKPNYDADIEVLPTCYSAPHSKLQQQFDSALQTVSQLPGGVLWNEVQLPAGPLFPTVTVGDITRQGILHKYRHLPAAEASQKYHEELLALRDFG